jgi:hypothetical protein
MKKQSKEISVGDELEKLKQYLRQENNEDAKRPLLYPLFHKLFKDKFKIESDACGADVYIEGQLLVESKTKFSQWLDGFYQALHYHRKFGLTYNTILVVAHNFVGFWKVDKIPQEAFLFYHTADVQTAPNVIGKENAKKTTASLKIAIKNSAIYWLEPDNLKGTLLEDSKNLTTESFEIKKILNNLDSDRIQINPHNFIHTIERLKYFFDNPIDAVHCFYTIVAYWDITSTATERPNGKVSVTGFKGHKGSDDVLIPPRKINEFISFIAEQYVFTNEGSGLTADYYFSRFDEVLAIIQPEYVKQHGIFFTNDNLSKFALWFVKENFSNKVHEDYIVFDPAGGSGNLISSWKEKLKHKIISELQPDLLKTIESRMKIDPFHLQSGFTIVPKTTDNKGLNFLDRSAEDYLNELKNAVKESSNVSIDKPIAFLLNPPYKNTDENVEVRHSTESEYVIDKSILALTGEDAGKERYLAFLGQILNISQLQSKEHELHPVVMVFTPTSWLIPRPTYTGFREIWDSHFKYHSGFLVASNEWFKLEGKWPIAFTIWTYNYKETGNNNTVKILDLTEVKKHDLNLRWNDDDRIIKKQLNKVLNGKKKIKLDNSRGEIRDTLPVLKDKNGNEIQQPRYNIYRNRLKEEKDEIVISGFPLKDDRHKRVKSPHGFVDGEYVGFMGDTTPVRLRMDTCNRFTNKPDRVWFRLDSDFKGINNANVFNGAADNRSFCAYDKDSARSTFSWYAISKACNGVYPMWANQFDLWPPQIKKEFENYYYSLCFAFVLAENRCVVTIFEKNNPVKGAPEIFVDNPLCPTNKESFWSTVLDKEITSKHKIVKDLVDKVKELYAYWNLKYCKGRKIESVGLQNEPYFKYFDYKDFLTPHSGLIQIRKYAELKGSEDLLKLFQEISELTKKVKGEIYRLLVEEFGYFE